MCAPLARVLLHCFVVSSFSQQAGGHSKFLLAEPTLKSNGVDKQECKSNATSKSEVVGIHMEVVPGGSSLLSSFA